MSADGTRVRVTPNLAFGICLVVVGTALVLDRLQLMEASQILQFWPLGLVLLGLTLVVQSFQSVDANEQARNQQTFPSGHIVGIVIVGLIVSQAVHRGGNSARGDSSETVNLFAVGSRQSQLSRAPVFRGGEMTAVMGRSDLDLRQTTVAPGEEAVIDVFTLWGESTIRVPAEWTVEIRAVPIMGGARDRRTEVRSVPGAPRIVVRGFVMMGGLSIRS
jgi:Domain of unknown function (DUF5668)/Cell wall-active antibiotics response 4TMS YvqF